MSKVNCNIIKDILPLYFDCVVSDETKGFVEKHLGECEECRNELEILKKQAIIPPETNSHVIKKLKKKMFRKSILISMISIICVIPIFYFLYNYCYNHEVIIPYSDIQVTVDEEPTYGKIYATFEGKCHYATAYNYFDRTIEIDGVQKNVVYLYFTDFTGIKYFNIDKKVYRDKCLIGIEDGNQNGLEQTDAAYYLQGDYISMEKYKEMDDEEFAKQTEDAILIWER